MCTWVSSYICVQKPSDCFLQYQAGWGEGGRGEEGSPPELFCFPFSSTVLLLFILYYYSVYFPRILFCYPLPLLFSSSCSSTILLHLISLLVCSYSSFDVLFLLLLLLCSSTPLLFCSTNSQSFLLPLLFYFSASHSLTASFLFCFHLSSTVLFSLFLF